VSKGKAVLRPEFARPSDESQIKHLLAECELPDEDLTAAHLRHFWVLRDGPQLVGVVGLEVLGRHSLLRSLAVPAWFRGRGVGSQLTSQAEKYAHSCGIEALYLLTTTAEDFFARRGYHQIDRNTVPPALQETAEFRSLCPSTAVCMAKRLS
jgi:amino-acid N-acetyltransferase